MTTADVRVSRSIGHPRAGEVDWMFFHVCDNCVDTTLRHCRALRYSARFPYFRFIYYSGVWGTKVAIMQRDRTCLDSCTGLKFLHSLVSALLKRSYFFRSAQIFI